MQMGTSTVLRVAWQKGQGCRLGQVICCGAPLAPETVTLFCESLPLCLDLHMEFVLAFPLHCEVWKVEIHFFVVSTQLPRGD